jgi:hypothetical protein
MAAHWAKKRVLITVRTYPTPASRGVEVSCTAGITDTGNWIRLYPIPYRSLDEDKRFSKYEWIDVEVTKARDDQRPESFKPNLDTIEIGTKVSSTDAWRLRKDIVRPLVKPSLCAIQAEREANGSPTLGIFKPKIDRLVIERADPAEWTPEQLTKLNQTLSLFETKPATLLEKIPYDFRYEFHCHDQSCQGHKTICTDWEIAQSYRKWSRDYGAKWEQAFREKYERQIAEQFDTYFFVGNLHQYPQSFIIVGLFYPPRQAMDDLFDGNRTAAIPT